ncbi:hypothetical protein ES703_67375 [subsurface metagenome]
MKIASKVPVWLAELVIRCLWFIETWWKQRKWSKEGRKTGERGGG